MLDADERAEADDASRSLPGAVQFWDGDKLLGHEVARSLDAAPWTAWDIYLFYPPGAATTDRGLAPPEAALAQVGGVVVGMPGTLPALPDQSRLPPKLAGRAVVVGEQADLEALLARAATAFAARHPRS